MQAERKEIESMFSRADAIWFVVIVVIFTVLWAVTAHATRGFSSYSHVHDVEAGGLPYGCHAHHYYSAELDVSGNHDGYPARHFQGGHPTLRYCAHHHDAPTPPRPSTPDNPAAVEPQADTAAGLAPTLPHNAALRGPGGLTRPPSGSRGGVVFLDCAAPAPWPASLGLVTRDGPCRVDSAPPTSPTATAGATVTPAANPTATPAGRTLRRGAWALCEDWVPAEGWRWTLLYERHLPCGD